MPFQRFHGDGSSDFRGGCQAGFAGFPRLAGESPRPLRVRGGRSFLLSVSIRVIRGQEPPSGGGRILTTDGTDDHEWRSARCLLLSVSIRVIRGQEPPAERVPAQRRKVSGLRRVD
jgi:hypothetical protein